MRRPLLRPRGQARFAAAIAACLAILGLSAAPTWGAASPSPKPLKTAVGAVFVAPPGWRRQPGKNSGLGVWLRPGDTGYSQNISVASKAGYNSLDALLKAEIAYVAGLPDQFGYAPKDTTLCGNHPAKYLSYTYTSTTGLPITTEEIIAVFGNIAYSARYNKSISQNADPAAERALMTLCGSASH